MTTPHWPPSLLGNNVRLTHADFVERVEANAMKNQSRPLDKNAIVSLREVTRDTVRAMTMKSSWP